MSLKIHQILKTEVTSSAKILKYQVISMFCQFCKLHANPSSCSRELAFKMTQKKTRARLVERQRMGLSLNR